MYEQHRPKIKAQTLKINSGSAIEAIIYEMKPLAYILFALTILNGTIGATPWIKFSSVGILLFSAYVVYARLVHRGYL